MESEEKNREMTLYWLFIVASGFGMFTLGANTRNSTIVKQQKDCYERIISIKDSVVVVVYEQPAYAVIGKTDE